MTLTEPQLEALAVLCQGPAPRTTGRTSPAAVNRQAVLALCRRGLAQGSADVNGTVFTITEEGRRAFEQHSARIGGGSGAADEEARR